MSNKNYRTNSFIKLILFILSTILTLLNNNVYIYILIFLEFIALLLLLKNQIKELTKYIFNVPFILIMIIAFLYSKSLFIKLFMIYFKMSVLLITTLPTHLILSAVRLLYPLTYLKINIKKLTFLVVYIMLYLKLLKLNINNVIKSYNYQGINLFKNKKEILLYSIYLTNKDVNNSLRELALDNLNMNFKSQLYGEKRANFKDYLLVFIYIGIIVLCLMKEVL